VQDRVLARSSRDDRRVVVEHAGGGNAAEALDRSHERGAEVAHRLGEREHRLVRGRVRQRRHQPMRLAETVLAHRDRDRQVPPVELADLAGKVAGALEAAPCQVARALFLEIVLQDRDAALIAARLEVLEDHRRRCLGVCIEHLGDVDLEGIQQRALGAAFVARWFWKPQEAVDGVARHRQLAGDRALGPPFPLVETVDLGPVMH
jgi:hypothetical protein